MVIETLSFNIVLFNKLCKDSIPLQLAEMKKKLMDFCSFEFICVFVSTVRHFFAETRK